MCAHNTKLELIIVSDVEHYRQLARDKVLESDRVLEIGCSTGQTTRVLAQRASRVVAVDCSAKMAKPWYFEPCSCSRMKFLMRRTMRLFTHEISYAHARKLGMASEPTH